MAMLAWTQTSAQATFTRRQIGNDTFYESTVTGDFTGDGVVDFISGNTLYIGPDWKKHALGIAWEGFLDWEFALDVDLDGKLDVLKGSTANGSLWYKNILPQTGAWPKHAIDADNKAHEAVMADLDGDGKAREHVAVDLVGLIWFSLDNSGAAPAWKKHTAVSSASLKCVGAGDVDGDGKVDLLRSDGWYKNPGDPKTPNWKPHCHAFGVNKGLSKRFLKEGPCGPIDHTGYLNVYDVDADGLNDIVVSAAHSDGIMWYRQKKSAAGDITFEELFIDPDIIRTHSTLLVDLDNDGDKDFLASSRPVYAADAQWLPNKPVVFNWYELKRGPAGVSWIKHPIAYDEDFASGTQMSAEDVDGDGDRDVLVASKVGGPWILENKLNPLSLEDHARRGRIRLGGPAGVCVLGFDGGRMRIVEFRAEGETSLDLMGRRLGTGRGLLAGSH